MDFVLDLLQGVGLAAAIGVRPWLPMLLAGALAAANLGLDFDGTDFAFLESVPLLVVLAVAFVAVRSLLERRYGERGPTAVYAVDRRSARRARGRRLAGGSRAHDRPRRDPRRRCRGARLPRRSRRCSRACGAAWTPRRRARCRSTPRASALVAAGLSILFPPLALLVVGRARVAADRGPPPRGREVRRPARTAVKKLVLAVIDAMKPAMLERAVASGQRAGAGAADRARRARRRLRRRVPVGHPGVRRVDRDRDRPRPPRDPVDELVPPRRGALRRVRHQLQGARRRSASSSRSPTRSTT